MHQSSDFVDLYNILQVDPDCDARTLEAAYRLLAKMYHPDHTATADVDRFNEVITAYRLLRDPADRRDYDAEYALHTGHVFLAEPGTADETTAISDADAHARILMLLYKHRRRDAKNAGVGQYFIQQELNCSDEAFDFYVWYLREKGFIETTDNGTLAITVAGVDYVMSTSRASAGERLRIAQTRTADDG